MKVFKQLFYKARFERLYKDYTYGNISWNEYFKRLEELNKKYEE